MKSNFSRVLTKKEFQILVGKRIRQLREERNLSQTELANLCEFERSNMNRIEAGNINPSAFVLYSISLKLNVDASELLNFKPLQE
ncbi:helix-turn-helix domain-containing protein [Flavobacterium humi]|uniref:XRE family transcriptional regulator n=1 Tax=Flavobacterium humi TaxID=2562683 RepID=A0A4Z0L550_9FLAO|nr:helix-turn-helix transcriptional regulator [Flavobacterium humi]TGD57512.1 XRE family transcriptional regulator [Flavobacterium humi]